ncbi:hypothetical protein KI387_026968, partial [Taxus chinensis]
GNDNLADGSPALTRPLNDPYCSHLCNYSNIHTMGGQLKRLEPDNYDSIKNDGE